MRHAESSEEDERQTCNLSRQSVRDREFGFVEKRTEDHMIDLLPLDI